MLVLVLLGWMTEPDHHRFDLKISTQAHQRGQAQFILSQVQIWTIGGTTKLRATQGCPSCLQAGQVVCVWACVRQAQRRDVG
jgi:hypothetical protein